MKKKEDLAIMRHDLRDHFNYIKYELDADMLMRKRKTLKTKLRSLNKNSMHSEFQKSSNESDEGKSEHKIVVKGFRLLRQKRNLMKQLHLIQDISRFDAKLEKAQEAANSKKQKLIETILGDIENMYSHKYNTCSEFTLLSLWL